jgi:hypothetical protein
MAEPISAELASKVADMYADLIEKIHEAGGDCKYYTDEYLRRIPAHDLMITLAQLNITFKGGK